VYEQRVYQDLGHQFRLADIPKTALTVPIEFGTHGLKPLP
jgi:hypothetical protein